MGFKSGKSAIAALLKKPSKTVVSEWGQSMTTVSATSVIVEVSSVTTTKEIVAESFRKALRAITTARRHAYEDSRTDGTVYAFHLDTARSSLIAAQQWLMDNLKNTPEDLLEQLRAEAKRLKRTPRTTDIDRSAKAGRTASLWAFIKAFGSWNKATKAAGLIPNNAIIKLSPPLEILIEQLRSEASRLGHAPTGEDITDASKEGRTHARRTFEKYFGSWNKALRAAGLTPEKLSVNRGRRELLAQLQAEIERLGHDPTLAEMAEAYKAGRTAHHRTYCRTFGYWAYALRQAKKPVARNPPQRIEAIVEPATAPEPIEALVPVQHK